MNLTTPSLLAVFIMLVPVMYSVKMKAVAMPRGLIQKREQIFLDHLVCFLFCLCSLKQRNCCYSVFNLSYAALLSDLQKA